MRLAPELTSALRRLSNPVAVEVSLQAALGFGGVGWLGPCSPAVCSWLGSPDGLEVEAEWLVFILAAE